MHTCFIVISIQVFLKEEIFHTNFVQKIMKVIHCLIFRKKNWRICSNVNMLQKETSHWSKYNTAHAHCMPDKKGYKTHNQNIEQKFILNSNNGKAKEPQLFVSNQIVYSS